MPVRSAATPRASAGDGKSDLKRPLFFVAGDGGTGPPRPKPDRMAAGSSTRNGSGHDTNGVWKKVGPKRLVPYYFDIYLQTYNI